MVQRNKNSLIKRLAIVLCICILFDLCFAGVDTFAARTKTPKIKLSKTSVSVAAGKTVKVNVKGSYKKVKVVASKSGYAKISVKGKKITIKGIKEGKVNITVRGYGKNGKLAATGKLKVNVKKKAAKKKTAPKKTTEQKTTEQKKTEQKTTEQKTTEKKNPDKKTTEQKTTEQKTSEQKTTEEKKPEQKTSTETGKPSADTTKYNAGEYSISKVHSGEATYYEKPSNGAANLDKFADENNYLTAAMNNEDYMNGLAGAYIEVTDKDGDVVKVLITDRLPEGKKGDIDLTKDAFKTIEPEVTGRMRVTWKIIPLPTDKPISFVWKEGSSKWWAQIQVRNGRYPIKKLEYLDKATNKYIELKREEYNYFTAQQGLGDEGPYTFRVTDFYGHEIIETNVAMNSSGTPVSGKQNFPY